ncbi:MAG: hypothetical protein H5U07_11330, partial [Candidatus Aminicenantes bacterium]|nr:hypothetical protein [Candidatus Aminicenantes bacterium]
LYLGGRSLATKLFYDRIDPKADPLGPGNIIVIATSPLVGSQMFARAIGRLLRKSPLRCYLTTTSSVAQSSTRRVKKSLIRLKAELAKGQTDFLVAVPESSVNSSSEAK